MSIDTMMGTSSAGTPDEGSSRDPRWSVDPRVVLRAVEGVGAVALRGEESTVLRGRAMTAVAQLVDGERASDDIVRESRHRVPAPEVYFALEQLRRREIIVETADPTALRAAAWWSDVGVARDVGVAIRSRRVALRTTGDVPDELRVQVSEALELAGIQVSVGRDDFSAGDGADLVVVFASDYTDPALAAINRRALETGTDWMLVWPDARTPWLGPLFQPGSSACWECLMNRRRTHRRLHAAIGEADGEPPVAMPALITPLASSLISRMVALEVAKTLGGVPGTTVEDAPEGAAVLREVHLADWSITPHVVVRRTQCEICGDPVPPAGAAIRPSAERARGGDDGGLRTATAEETYRRYRHHVSPLTGAVPALVEQSTPDPAVHVWQSGTNLGLAPLDLLTLDRTVRANTAGKGTTSGQARIGALAEALERYSSIRQGGETVIRGSLRSLGEAAINPNRAMLFSDAQLDDAARNGSPDAWFNRVPHRFDEAADMEWTPVWSLTHDREFLLPTAYCYYGSPNARELGIVSDSNGCAAGNTLTEAILQGFLELVERDGVAMWWYNRVRRPAVDLASFKDHWIDDMVSGYRRRGREVWAIDLTTDLGIPVFAAISRRIDDPLDAVLTGFGAHLDPRIAMLRAIAEVNQMSGVDLHLIDEKKGMDSDLMSWLRNATVENQPYLLPDPDAAPWRFADHPSRTGAHLGADVETCRASVERAGLDMYVLDQTRPDIGLPVVRVIVPGLRPFWSRLAPGRLYDVPVQLGWLASPTRESELNPIPFFL